MKQETTVKFTGCKHLDFSDNYTVKKNLIRVKDGTKVCWNRPVMGSYYPSLVQFCKLRGRLNNPESCLCDEHKQCSDYEETEHEVTNIQD